MRYRKKPIEVEAYRWFHNGDHPNDDSEFITLTQEEINVLLKAGIHANSEPFLTEGKVVRYYNNPDDFSDRICSKCQNEMHIHGWIDTLEGGHIVCPGDWIITGIKGEYYPCKPDIFEQTYEEVE